MTIIVKSRDRVRYPAGSLYYIVTPHPGNPNSGWTGTKDFDTVLGVGDTIAYQAGPKYCRSRYTTLNWKECTHQYVGKRSGRLSPYRVETPNWWNGGPSEWRYKVETYSNGYLPRYRFTGASIPSINQEMVQDMCDEIFDNIDLNVHDSVMCYSAVLQALPMLGGVFKVNRVLRKISEHVTRRMRRKPFTTVVKDMISADFLNRFVIQTTLKDMHDVASAMDVVVSHFATAAQRNMQDWTVLESSKTISQDYGERDTGSNKIESGTGTYVFAPYTARGRTQVQYKIKSLAKLRYNTDIVSPLKVWFDALGVTKPLESAWDLLPFSFVADYFFRTGDIVDHISDQMASSDGLSGQILEQGPVWCMTNASVDMVYHADAIELTSAGNKFNAQESDSVVSDGTFERHPLPSTMLRSFWNRSNLIQSSVSTTKWRTIAQLLVQAKL